MDRVERDGGGGPAFGPVKQYHMALLQSLIL